ncbi:MAG: ribosome-associated translation inhibitor RaiA [Acidimicrobiales bacterium]|nr:ribosome-associated translation inhibitor RaiA [Acidimicrobiales bacterium]
MDISVSSRNGVQVSESLRATAEEKIGRLSRFLSGMNRAEVRFSQERNPRISDKEICEVTLEGHGHHVRARVAAHDQFVAVDKAVSKLEHQLSKLKTKLELRTHGAPKGAVAVLAGAPAGPEEAEGGLRIVRTKRFEMKPMTPEEAALQMDLLGHGFYFFRNADTGQAAVVYHRADGDVGLIDEAG